MTRNEKHPSHRRLAALAAPALPMSALTLPMIIFLPEFYAHSLGLNLALVGFIFTFVRLGDLVFDPFVGGLMDRTRTRWGQFRPWLLLGGPLVMAGTWMLFMAQPGVGPVYLSLGLVMAYIGYSIVVLAQMGMGATITSDYRQRSRVFAWWMVFNTLGQILVMAMPVFFADRIANDSSFTVRTMGWFILASVPVTIAACVACIREGDAPTQGHAARLRDYLGLFTLPSTRLLLLTQLLVGLGLGISAAVFLFFFTMLKQVPFAYVGLQFVAFYIVGVITAPVWSLIANRIGRHRALALGCCGFAAYMVLMMAMPPGNLVYFFGMGLLGGTMACSVDMLPRSMMADVSDEDRLASGQDRTGMLFALLTVTHKFGQAMSIGVVYFALDLIGFKAGSTANGALALNGVAVLYGIVPGLLYIASALVVSRFGLTPARHDAIRRELAAAGSAPASAG
ncbi:Na+/melibiose symporter-like transporter [Sphingobium fontiphilum]|uniref:Na+/melibiose symporter-like transporter n=1 Tax=Sphingobium fontiphilum TaxID=944425 RepID=A0A7W6GQM5_9SPHN|nr:MFS transporter [Sphingobium fontiphilum]MBB3982219.1 Na+/melibiose symporter-like transporter [Sphingobium fontiphilum]